MIPTNKTSSTLASASHSETEDASSLTANVHSNPKVDPSRKTYAELDLPPELHRALADLNFIHPTPIQEKAIPIALTGQDIIGCAATGTGKTAAFLIPLLTKLIDEPEATALVLLPTRELALQVGEVHHDLTKYLRGMGAVTLIGGVAMGNQLKGLARRPRLIVATPGRLLDHLGRNSVSLKKLGFLVLDEADRMLDMGFQPQLREILRYLPHERQTMLFSATLPANILELSSKYLVDPARVDIKGAPTLDGKPAEPQKLNIAESTVQVEQKEKNETLLDELNAREGSVLVFARTQSRVDRVCRYLESYDISVARIHGGRTQGQRVRALDGFRDGSTRVLIATDLASRGIDIDHVAHVINFDLPQAPEDYVHRIGRTGRAGRSGQAVSFVTREDAPMWRAIERLKSGVESIGPPGANAPRSGRPSGGGEGRRNSRPNSRDGGGPRGAGRNGARSSERGRGGNPSNVSARDREQASTRREQAEFSPRARAEAPTSDRGFTDRSRGERSDGRGPTFNANSNPNSRGGESSRRDSGSRTTSDRSPPSDRRNSSDRGSDTRGNSARPSSERPANRPSERGNSARTSERPAERNSERPSERSRDGRTDAKSNGPRGPIRASNRTFK